MTNKELKQFYEQFKYIEGAVWQNYNSLNECMAVLGLIKSELERHENKPYRAIKAIDALFTLIDSAQSDLMDQAKIEY